MSHELKPLAPAARQMFDRRGQRYEPTVGPKLRVLLVLVFLMFALLGANGAYMGSLKLLNWATGQTYENWFYPWMLFGHLALGYVFFLPLILFVALHLKTALGRPNQRAVRLGFAMLAAGAVLMGTGVLMVHLREYFPTTTPSGQVVYWLHVLSPVAIMGLYIAHRLAGPRIQWRYAKAWAAAVGLIVLGFGYLHYQDPRQWNVKGANEDYFFPSAARTIGEDGGTPFLPAHAMTNDQYCQRCHPDAYAGWFHSAHHFASFNNLAYRQTILEMRRTLEREAAELASKVGVQPGTEEYQKLRARKVQATRWCAGCHDPVPFFTGAFDNDRFFQDLEVQFPLDGSAWKDESLQKQPTAHAGITCVSCHGITHVNSVTGNADYTIQEPLAYPFTYSDNAWLLAINEYLIKAKPDLHKRTMLKPFHRTAEFCQVCHKVHLPKEVNDYKWVRGQNHYDSWHASGASGFGARSFYSPAAAKKCSDCHMPLMESRDFGNLQGRIHNHLFLGANTALPTLRQYFGQRNLLLPTGDEADVIHQQQEFLHDKKVRIDLFGLRDRGEIDGGLRILRPELPELIPGEIYLLEVVVRNLGVGHEFTQGTIDSNEVWVEVQATSGGQPIGGSGGIDPAGYVDPWAHFLNAVVLDRRGNRIDRRNAKDIFVPLFSHQVPPSGSQVVHYRLRVPPDAREPVELKAFVRYRKFDRIYQDFFMSRRRYPQAGALQTFSPLGGIGQVWGPLAWYRLQEVGRGPELPVTMMAEDRVLLPVRGGALVREPLAEGPPAWERWNDYGIGLFLQGDEGAERGLLRQAEGAFLMVTRLRPEYADGYLNLARVYLKEGRLADMAQVLEKARQVQPNYFKTAWLRAELNRQNGRLADAIADYREVLSTRIPERGFDFSKDREIRRQLGDTLYLKAQLEPDGGPEQKAVLEEAVAELHQVLKIDPEDRQSHYLLHKCYQALGDAAAAEKHLKAYAIYQVDNSARDHALRTFRLAHPWADHAAQAVVVYELK